VMDARELVVVKEHAACTDLDHENTGQDNHLVVGVGVGVDHIVVYRIHDGFLLNDDADDEDSRKIE
jgi:6-phosphogluconolactonase (cycloisomerase 2 family)